MLSAPHFPYLHIVRFKLCCVAFTNTCTSRWETQIDALCFHSGDFMNVLCVGDILISNPIPTWKSISTYFLKFPLHTIVFTRINTRTNKMNELCIIDLSECNNNVTQACIIYILKAHTCSHNQTIIPIHSKFPDVTAARLSHAYIRARWHNPREAPNHCDTAQRVSVSVQSSERTI